ncbi:MAG: adenine deaminase [Thermodesulfovibrionales bacterium]|nr:adenine deaminase [Thermodesulfovibrionales bacterium]
MKKVSGNIVDVLNAEIFPGTLLIVEGIIKDIVRVDSTYKNYLIPGFIDAHVHIESTMLVPSEFARIAAIHGTVATVSDPHEIANVLGLEGIAYMIENARSVPVRFYFGAPSCVPATELETSGATLGVKEVEKLLRMKEINYLAEVMNFPGVIHDNPEIHEKIKLAHKYGKPIDGHAPGLRGNELKKYVSAGITTDHEMLSREEALEKIRLGMKILIREGSAAKNFDALITLVDEYPEHCMFCSDDKHPDELVQGHINEMVKRAARLGIDHMKVLRAACVNPVLHYGLDTGLLQSGDSADFLLVDNLKDFTVIKAFIGGEVVAELGRALIHRSEMRLVNRFYAEKKRVQDFIIPAKGEHIRVIEAINRQLITGELTEVATVLDGNTISNAERNIHKIVVVNRYRNEKPAIGFVRNFGLIDGALASSIAHDSHNIIAVGVSDEHICRAVNLIIEHKGGICAISRDREMILPLPVAGIMSSEEYTGVAEKYSALDKMAKELGSFLDSPFMTLSFMALPVIPKLKLTDKGLFDAKEFKFVDLFVST